MKKLLLSLLMLGLATSAMAIDKNGLDNRIRKLTAKFEAMQRKPDKAVPADMLKNAKGIILLDRTKAGFIFGYQGGSGVAMVRDEKSKEWSAPAFYNANEGSVGFQVGGQQTFMVILLMDTNSVQALVDHNGEFGGEAEGTAGNKNGREGETYREDGQSVVVYTDTSGLYGGATIKGGAISPSEEDNMKYYNQYLVVEEILFKKKVKPTEVSKALADKLDAFAKPKKD